MTCPLNGKPCKADCPDRYQDRPGCVLTTAASMGARVVSLGKGDAAIVFTPKGGQNGEQEPGQRSKG